MISVRRRSLEAVSIERAHHAGLWLDRFLAEPAIHGDAGARERHATAVADIVESMIYGEYFKRWRKSLEESHASLHEALVVGRLLVGHGQTTPADFGITLHHTYGVPYIPGSALKGLAARHAHRHLERWQKGEDAHRVVFGTQDTAGYVVFFDAMYVPGWAASSRPLKLDVLTPHQKPYYDDRTDSVPPADWHDPVPLHFLSATGRYLLALAGPHAWVARSFEILELALGNVSTVPDEGIGAKTSSGYGRLSLLQE